jgi:hypothetical protein
MSFDLIVLVLTTIGLVMSPTRSSLWQLLFQQGIIYFLVAFIASMTSAIFLVLNLNSTCLWSEFLCFTRRPNLKLVAAMMNMMFCLPAVVASSIVACRSFVSLANFQQSDVYVHSMTAHPTTRQRPPGGGFSGGDATRGLPAGSFASDGSLAKTTGDAGNIIAGIAFRGMGASVDSVSQGYDPGELNAPRTISAAAAEDSKCGYGIGDTSESGEVVLHVEMTAHEHDDMSVMLDV